MFGGDECAMQVGHASECLVTFLFTNVISGSHSSRRNKKGLSLVNVSIQRAVHISVMGSVATETTVLQSRHSFGGERPNSQSSLQRGAWFCAVSVITC